MTPLELVGAGVGVVPELLIVFMGIEGVNMDLGVEGSGVGFVKKGMKEEEEVICARGKYEVDCVVNGSEGGSELSIW